jgi:1-acyl-sn-glycerol-3-phosphate acyltransferase
VTSRWDEAEPPALPEAGPAGTLRLVARAAWAAATLAVLFALFLVLRGVDWLGERVARRPVTRLGPAIVRAWAALALPTVGLRYVAHGRPMTQPGAYVANHSSWLDIVALQRAAAPFLVSKAEVRDWPGIGFIGRAIGTMFIDRRPAEAKRQEAELHARLARGDRMAIFPEGTSTDGLLVLPFKSSLFGVFFAPELKHRLFVQPVTIRYRPAPGLPPSLYGWWGGMDFAGHLRTLMTLSTGGVVELTFHPPLRAADFSGRKALAERAGTLVREGFERLRQG